MRKNVAGQAAPSALLLDTNGSAVTTGTTTVYVTGDNGTQASGGGTVTHEGNGVWSYAPTQAETNYDHISFAFVNSGAVTALKDVYTDQAADLVAALNDLAAADIRTAVGLASANLDTQLAALPTAAENRAEMDSNSTQLAAIVADTGTDIPALIAALNDFNPATDTVSANVVGLGALTLATGTAQAGATATITLAAGASAVDDFYKGGLVLITGGTGAGQGRTIESYVGSTKVATVADSWATTPSTDSTYMLIPKGISIVDSSNPIPAQVVDMTAAGLAKLFSVDSGTAYASAVAGSVVKEIADNGAGLDAAGVRSALGMAAADLDTQLDAIVADTGTDIPATLATIAGYLDTEIAAILDDTNELQTDLTDGGRLDLLIDSIITLSTAIKAKTDSLKFTVAGEVDSNVQSVNDAALTGNGQVGTEWGPA